MKNLQRPKEKMGADLFLEKRCQEPFSKLMNAKELKSKQKVKEII